MNYTNLGTSGLKVSRIALGCISFGTPRDVMPWTLGEDAAQPIVRQALDLGITFWDTANVYGAGTSEEIVGRAVKELTIREAIVLATKIYWPITPGRGRGGLRRCSDAAECHGWTKFISMQDQYSLLAREEEREMFGVLAGVHRRGNRGP